MRSRIPDMNEKELEKMAFLQRCLHCLHVVGERIEVGVNHRSAIVPLVFFRPRVHTMCGVCHFEAIRT